MEEPKIKKNSLAVTGLSADTRQAGVIYQMQLPKLPFTIGFQFYCHENREAELFTVSKELSVRLIGGNVHVLYQGESMFISAVNPQNIASWAVNTVDLCCQKSETALYINGTLIGSSETPVAFSEQGKLKTVFGGGSDCYLRWFRVYDALLTESQIKRRRCGLESKYPDNFKKLPAIFLDFSEDECLKQLEFENDSDRLALTECLKFNHQGAAVMMPNRALFTGGAGSLYFTVYLPFHLDQTECLFSSGTGNDEFSLLIRRESGNAYLDVGVGTTRLNGIGRIPLNAWVDLTLSYQNGTVSTYINGVCDIEKSEPLPAGALQVQPSWCFGNHTQIEWNAYSGYISYFSVLNLALTEAQITEALCSSINKYSGNVFCAFGFNHNNFFDLQPAEVFYNKNAVLTILQEKISSAQVNDQINTLFLDNSLCLLSREDREKAVIAFEFSAQMCREMYGADLLKNVEDLSDAQLSAMVPYADGIGEVYKKNSYVFFGFQPMDSNISGQIELPDVNLMDEEEMMHDVLTGIGITFGICGVISYTVVSLAQQWFMARIIDVAVAHILDTYGITIAEYSACIAASAFVLDLILFGHKGNSDNRPVHLPKHPSGPDPGKEPGKDPQKDPEKDPEKDPNPGQGKYSLKITLEKAYFAKVESRENPSIYMKESFSIPAPEEEWVSSRNNADNPAKLCLIRKAVGDSIPMELCLTSQETEAVDVIITGMLCYGGQSFELAMPNQGKATLKAGNNKISTSVKLPENIKKSNKTGFYFTWQVKESASLLKRKKFQAPYVAAYILDQKPQAPWDVTSRYNTVSENDLDLYAGFFKQSSTLTEYAAGFSDYLKKTYSITQSASPLVTMKGAEGASTVYYKPFVWKEKDNNLSTLDCASILALNLALGGYSARIVGIEAAMPAFKLEQTVNSFPLSLRSEVCPDSAIAEELDAYYAVEAKEEEFSQNMYFDIFSKDSSLNGHFFDNGNSSYFCATDKKGGNTFRSLLVQPGTTAVVAERYTNIQLVSELPKPSSEEGVCIEETDLCPISMENGLYQQTGQKMEYDKLIRENYSQESFSLFRIIGQENIISLLTEIMNRKLTEKNFAELLDHLYGAIHPTDDYVDVLIDRYQEGAIHQLKLIKQLALNENTPKKNMLVAVNRLLSNLAMIKENISLAYSGKRVSESGFYPRHWFYYANEKVWSSNKNVIEKGMDYQQFSAMCEMILPDRIEHNGIYLMEQNDCIRGAHLTALHTAGIEVPHCRQLQGSFLNYHIGQPSCYIYVDSCRNALELERGTRRVCQKKLTVYGINEELEWKEMLIF